MATARTPWFSVRSSDHFTAPTNGKRRSRTSEGKKKKKINRSHTHPHRQRTTPPTPTHTHTRQEQHPRLEENGPQGPYVLKDQQVTHTNTQQEQDSTRHDENNTPNPQTNTSHKHITTLEGGAATVRATSHARLTWRVNPNRSTVPTSGEPRSRTSEGEE